MHMIYMSSSKFTVIQFKSNPFEFKDVKETTGLSPTSTRNLLSSLISEGIITSGIKQDDRRKRKYKLKWQYFEPIPTFKPIN